MTVDAEHRLRLSLAEVRYLSLWLLPEASKLGLRWSLESRCLLAKLNWFEGILIGLSIESGLWLEHVLRLTGGLVGGERPKLCRVVLASKPLRGECVVCLVTSELVLCGRKWLELHVVCVSCLELVVVDAKVRDRST